MNSLRVAFVLAGLHRVPRGAEVAFESIARELARRPGFEVTLIGSGQPRAGEPYRFCHVPCVARERFEHWPRVPGLRSDCACEELSFVSNLLRVYRPADHDLTLCCSYPFTNWALRGRHHRRKRPAHVFVTQNGDWPARQLNAEFTWFGCEGLVCTNPEYFERHRDRWPCTLIPNGVNHEVFRPGIPDRASIGVRLPPPTILMVSALIPSKRVLEGIRCAAALPDVNLVIAGDGPLRGDVDDLGASMMPGRFQRLTLPPEAMPGLYRAANVLLHMSKEESFGNVLVEALATGLPVIAHDRQASRWILEDRAMLVDTDDADAVIGAVEKAMDHNSPAEIAARLELVHRRFTWSAVTGDYEKFFNQVLAVGNPSLRTGVGLPRS